MTPGSWITVVARRILDTDTFELVVSPAIADVQFEAPHTGGLGLARGYAGILAALVGALVQDLRTDVRLLRDDAGTLAILIGIQCAYYACPLTLMRRPITTGAVDRVEFSPYGLLLPLAVLVLSLVTTMLCFWPERRVRE